MRNIGITVYGCENDEADVFRKISPNFGIVPTILESPVSSCGMIMNCGNRCVCVDHKTKVSESNLITLKKAGVKYISTRSVGIDHIDTEAAMRMGITIGNVAYSPNGVADYTIMLLLMILRNAKSIVTSVKNFDFRLNSIRGKELRDMTVGVIGNGHIGKAVIERLHGFGCRILTYDKIVKENYVPLHELFEKSDIITLHMPLNAETHHIIGRNELGMLKQGAFLVNTGRGALVDTNELIKSLDSGKLGGVALDVLEGEEGLFYSDCSKKIIDNKFLLKLQKMPNVIITPHTAYYTERALYETIEKTILNCIEFERDYIYE